MPQAVIGANIITYSGKSSNDGQGSVAVGPLGSPSSVTPSVSTTKSGGPLGAVKYWRTDVYEDGESEPSAVSSTVTPATVATPAAITTAAVQHHVPAVSTYVGSPVFDYVSAVVSVARSGSSFSFTANFAGAVPGARVRISGSTTGAFDGVWTVVSISGGPGSPSLTMTCQGISTSAPSSDSGCRVALVTDGPLLGDFDYGISLLSALGETDISPVRTITASGPNFSGTGGTLTATTGGNLTSGSSYLYFTTIYDHSGRESSPQVINFNTAVALGFSDTAVSVSIPSSGFAVFSDTRIAGVYVYRTRANQTTPFRVRAITREQLAQNHSLDGVTAFVFVDTLSDGSLTVLPSNEPIGAAIGLGGLTTTSDTRCTGRRVWRRVNGTSTWFPLTLIGDRDTTIYYLDVTPASQLGQGVTGRDPRPFGGAAVNLAFAAGGAGVLSSNFYRSKDSGSIGFYCGSAAAGATTYEDTKADEDLGREMPTSSRRRTAAGSTALRVKDTTKFSSSGGWGRAGSQVFLYGGRSTTSGEGNLTSVPASGMGALLAPVSADQEVVVEPHLLGVSALSYAVEKGTRARIYVVVNSSAAQTALAALEGGDGVREGVVDDDSVTSVTALTEVCTAELSAFDDPQASITFLSRNLEIRSGKTITVSLGSPTSLSGSYLIQEVTLTEFAVAENTFPLRRVVAAPVRFTFQDFLRRAQLNK